MLTTTRSTVTHRTQVRSEQKAEDGGRSLLLELFDDVRGDKREGTLTAQFGPGGSIRLLTFEETELIRQNEIEVETPVPVKIPARTRT